jgi:hypothetical protein
MINANVKPSSDPVEHLMQAARLVVEHVYQNSDVLIDPKGEAQTLRYEAADTALVILKDSLASLEAYRAMGIG